MIDLHLDTETSGLNNFRLPYDHPSQPAIVQIAALLTEGDMLRASINLILVPNKDVEPGAEKVHGISKEVIGKFGVVPNVGIPMFNNLLKKADRVVAFNADFDINVVSKAYKELGADPTQLRTMTRVCTMKSSMYEVNLPPNPGRKEPKWPKLIDAYKHLVDPNGFDGAHDAMADVVASWKVLQALTRRNVTLTA